MYIKQNSTDYINLCIQSFHHIVTFYSCMQIKHAPSKLTLVYETVSKMGHSNFLY